jgi:hypothetical protein
MVLMRCMNDFLVLLVDQSMRKALTPEHRRADE